MDILEVTFFAFRPIFPGSLFNQSHAGQKQQQQYRHETQQKQQQYCFSDSKLLRLISGPFCTSTSTTTTTVYTINIVVTTTTTTFDACDLQNVRRFLSLK